MVAFSDNVKNMRHKFLRADVLMQFIYINVAVFIVVIISLFIGKLAGKNIAGYFTYIELPSSFSVFIRQPWTLITYMFLHYDLLHILFNMLWLFWFGRIFLSLFNARQLGALYVLGGIGGGILYLLAFNLIPFFANQGLSYMIGASASVLAIVVAPAIVAPNYPLRLFIFGEVKLKYIVLITILLDIYFLSTTSGDMSGDNHGGHLAHLGGALVGFLFAWRLSKGKDITRWMSRCLDWFWNLLHKKPKMEVTFNNINPKKSAKNKKQQTAQEKTEAKEDNNKVEEDELNRILDKLKQSGYENLSDEEKKKLFHASR